jgi:hypothetical protein
MMQITDLVMTKQVLVFMLIPLINTNKRRNQRWFRMYPETGPVLMAPVASFPRLDIVSIRTVRCSQTKAVAVQMTADK